MHSLRSAAVQYTNYGIGGAFELPTQSGTYALYATSGAFEVSRDHGIYTHIYI